MTASTQPYRDEIIQDAADLAAMAEALGRSTDYRVLRRLVPRTAFAVTNGQTTKTGVLLDTERTGLDHSKDEIIELRMVKFDYLPDGRIAGVRDTFSAFKEPSIPIPVEITALTGITDDLVAGHRIDEAAVTAFVDDGVIIIAHNSGFNRKFAERYWPIFERKAWGVLRPRFNGASTASRALVSTICCTVPASSTRPTGPSTIATHCSRYWR